MSRNWSTCRFCSDSFSYGEDYSDVCSQCDERIADVIRLALEHERVRISTAITAAAAEVGGVGAKVMELVARAIKGGE